MSVVRGDVGQSLLPYVGVIGGIGGVQPEGMLRSLQSCCIEATLTATMPANATKSALEIPVFV